MIVTAFSDTHGLHRKVTLPKSSILIFAGDCMTCGYKEHELIDFLEWYHEQDAPNKVMIAGNHDRFIENHRGLFLEMLNDYPSIKYLEDDGDIINGLWIWGTPHVRHFCNWAFNRSEEQLEKAFSNIPDDVDILITHGPQYGTLDKFETGEHIGEKTLEKRINDLTHIRYHIFGHVHCEYGMRDNPQYKSLNVSQVNEQYQLVNKPMSLKIYPHG
jgi:calcineurin-like phosphoesterase family protein